MSVLNIKSFFIYKQLSAINLTFYKTRISAILSSSSTWFHARFFVISKKNHQLFAISFLSHVNLTVKNIVNNLPFAEFLTYVLSYIINWFVFHNIVFLSCQDLIVTKTKFNIFVNNQMTPRTSIPTAQYSKWRNK